MRRTRLRATLLALPALMGIVLTATTPAGAEPAGPPTAGSDRSPLEDEDAVRHVRIQMTGGAMLEKVVDAGIDVGHGLQRVPDGIEAEAVVTAGQVATLTAMGVRILGADEGFEWSHVADGGLRNTSARTAQATAQPANTATARIVRADWFTTKGQGFLYVEARTTEGQQTTPIVGMQLENDSGRGTEFGFARTMSRFVDSGQYMFHRNLFKLDTRPNKIRVTSSTGGVATGVVSDWLENAPPPLTSARGYKSDFIDGYKTPQQLFARAEEIARQYPDIAEIVYLPHETNGYQRKAQATIGGTGQSAVVVSSAAWGHEGGNDITVEFANQPGANLPLAVEVTGKAVRVLLATDAAGAATSTAAEVAAALQTQSQGLIDRAHPYRTNTGTGVVVP
ncbi:hypothetical protein E1091_13075, partial [Micromonospora fluostatini]